MSPYPPPRTPRPYANPSLLLDIYVFMLNYEEEHKFKPSIAEIVNEEFSPSASVIRYYFVRMERLGMIIIPQLTVTRKGVERKITPARAIQLLPLADADPLIRDLAIKRKLIEKEPEHVSV